MARLDGHRRVTVQTPDGGTAAMTARHAVVICTGSRTALPELAGLAEARPWTNRHATDSHAVPGRLAIVGGGRVGVEMASAWQGLGSAVTLLAQADGLLPRMEPFAGKVVGRALAEAGVDVRIGVTVTGIRRPGGTGPVTLTLEDAGQVEADEALFATGRAPLTDDIGLESVGLVPGSWLEVDDTCVVRALTGGWLYALGDINGHACSPTRASTRPVSVELTADQAERAGHRIRVIDVDPARRCPGPACTPTATPAAPGCSSTKTTATCSASPRRPRRGRTDPLGDDRRGRPRSRSAGSGTPCPASPPSARSGSACSRATRPEPVANH